MMSKTDGILYIVATPIGNLDDFSFRAVEILKSVDLIAAEDTRHSRYLLDRYGIHTVLTSLHKHNERSKSERLLNRLIQGESIAIISDAGTPLISDPGFLLVRLAQQSHINIIPLPGPCALITALSASGLPSDHFIFGGFPPRNPSARKTRFKELLRTQGTLIFYEASHRIYACISDIREFFPVQREIVIARELTKLHETIVHSTVGEIVQLMEQDPFMGKGEFVVLIEGAPPTAKREEISLEHERTLRLLLNRCSLKESVQLAYEITGVRKKALYRRALEIEHTKKTETI